MLILSRAQLEGLVNDGLVDAEATRRALCDVLGRQGLDAHTVAPSALRLAEDNAAHLPLVGVDLRSGLVTSKTLTDRPSNAAEGLPTQVSAVSVINRTTGRLEALLHGAIPTRLRTAGVSAVATDVLARRDATRLGLVGAGALAIEHALAINRVRPLDRITVWSRSEASVMRFRCALAESWAGDLPPLTAAADPRQVVDAADIVCTLTPSTEPVVRGAWLRPGQHLNVVGARPRATDREVDAAAMVRSRVFVDHRPTVEKESGDLLLAAGPDGTLPDVVAELSQVLRGEVPGRLGSDDITLYNSVGTGLQDTAIAEVILEAARRTGTGTEVDFDG